MKAAKLKDPFFEISKDASLGLALDPGSGPEEEEEDDDDEEEADQWHRASQTKAYCDETHSRCVPCYFHHLKEDGCRWGDSCVFCHGCTEEQFKWNAVRIKKERKKEKRRMKRSLGRELKRVPPAHQPPQGAETSAQEELLDVWGTLDLAMGAPHLEDPGPRGLDWALGSLSLQQ